MSSFLPVGQAILLHAKRIAGLITTLVKSSTFQPVAAAIAGLVLINHLGQFVLIDRAVAALGGTIAVFLTAVQFRVTVSDSTTSRPKGNVWYRKVARYAFAYAVVVLMLLMTVVLVKAAFWPADYSAEWSKISQRASHAKAVLGSMVNSERVEFATRLVDSSIENQDPSRPVSEAVRSQIQYCELYPKYVNGEYDIIENALSGKPFHRYTTELLAFCRRGQNRHNEALLFWKQLAEQFPTELEYRQLVVEEQLLVSGNTQPESGLLADMIDQIRPVAEHIEVNSPLRPSQSDTCALYSTLWSYHALATGDLSFYEEAVKWRQRSLEILDKVREDYPYVERHRGTSYSDMGSLYCEWWQQSDPAELANSELCNLAVDNFEQSLAILRPLYSIDQSGYSSELADALIEYGTGLLVFGNSEAAIPLWEEAIEVCDQSDQVSYSVLIRAHVGAAIALTDRILRQPLDPNVFKHVLEDPSGDHIEDITRAADTFLKTCVRNSRAAFPQYTVAAVAISAAHRLPEADAARHELIRLRPTLTIVLADDFAIQYLHVAAEFFGKHGIDIFDTLGIDVEALPPKEDFIVPEDDSAAKISWSPCHLDLEQPLLRVEREAVVPLSTGLRC